jgi:hypothetical protein
MSAYLTDVIEARRRQPGDFTMHGPAALPVDLVPA